MIMHNLISFYFTYIFMFPKVTSPLATITTHVLTNVRAFITVNRFIMVLQMMTRNEASPTLTALKSSFTLRQMSLFMVSDLLVRNHLLAFWTL